MVRAAAGIEHLEIKEELVSLPRAHVLNPAAVIFIALCRGSSLLFRIILAPPWILPQVA
jgi:hypothetical protein